MPLEHISMWHASEGWTKITDTEADQLFSTTIRASEKIFICDLCHSHVIFVKGTRQISHFKHSRGDLEKECTDRTQALAQNEQSILRETITNPIRIRTDDSNAFWLEIGFLPMPNDVITSLNAYNAQVSVSANDKILLTKNVDKSNFAPDEVVFHSIGNVYSKRYKLNLSPPTMNNQYPLLERVCPGLNATGTIFSYVSGQKLPVDGDIEVGKQYYLLTTASVYGSLDIAVNRLSSDKQYSLYVVMAKAISKDSTEFFFNYHCRLTPFPAKLTLLWPIIHECEHYIETNQTQLYYLLKGDSAIKLEPPYLSKSLRTTRLESNHHFHLVHIMNVTYVRMLWATRVTSILRCLSVYHSSCEQHQADIVYEPIEICKDDQQLLEVVESDVYSNIPPKGRLLITLRYDGKIIRSKSGNIYYCITVKADQTVMLEKISLGDNIKVYHGMDEVASLSFVQQHKSNKRNDKIMCNTLLACRGETVPFPSRFNWVVLRLQHMPQTMTFLQDALRERCIKREAFYAISNLIQEELRDGN